jgi:hypothetical protein
MPFAARLETAQQMRTSESRQDNELAAALF